jgi:hypothetical protein
MGSIVIVFSGTGLQLIATLLWMTWPVALATILAVGWLVNKHGPNRGAMYTCFICMLSVPIATMMADARLDNGSDAIVLIAFPYVYVFLCACVYLYMVSYWLLRRHMKR